MPVGGAEYIAAHVNRLKARNPHHAVVGAGDMIGATPLISSLFHDEPSVETLNRIGLEFNAVGDHEFDKGSATLLRRRAAVARGRRQGRRQQPPGREGRTPCLLAKFQWLSANVVVTATGRRCCHLRRQAFQGVPVAFIGMTLKDTLRSSCPPAWLA